MAEDCTRQALVMVPEISLTPQMTLVFEARFPGMLAVVHSAMSDPDRWAQLDRIRQGDAKILVGPRSSIFAPFVNLALIIVDEGAQVHYVEGCTAPMYTSESLHSAVVEVIVKKNARCRYTTIQNWANNIYNLVTKRAFAYQDAVMEWVDGNLGSKLTMKYPAVYMMEPGARGEILSIAFSSAGQHQDAGAKLVHCAPNTTGSIISKSISKNGGRSSYRGLARVEKGAVNSKCSVVCDALILDDKSRSDTYPYIEINEQDVSVGHEASVSRIGEEQLFYLMSRGLSETEASTMIVNGFIEPLVKELPMEYAVEMNRLIQLQMEGSVG
jgi:Fe-S cluster assembly protein SufB